MQILINYFPDPDSLIQLEPEELGSFVLEALNAEPNGSGLFNRANFASSSSLQLFPANKRDEIGKALVEAWMWLEREGLIAPRPGDTHGWYYITKRGERLKDHEGVKRYHKANLLPKKLLHPTISTKCWAAYLRGDFDTAVFQAFKEVEVFVREAGNYSPTDIGVPLMRKAFDSKNGPLRDQSVSEAEREALAHLFAGSIGLFKNPTSHRHPQIAHEEAIELLILASHLLRIVDSGLNAQQPKPPHRHEATPA